MITASELKEGMAIRIEGQVYKVLAVESKAGAAKLNGVVKTKLRNVTTGRGWEPHFRPDERMEDLQLDQHPMEFLFSSAETSTFMNPRTFEQVELPRKVLGTAEPYLEPGKSIRVEFFEAQPVAVVLPDIVEARIASTAPAAHAQQDSTWKDALLENGVRILVPLFIAPGEMVRVDVRSGRYIERVARKRSA